MKDKVIIFYLDLRTISTLTLRKTTFGFGNLKTLTIIGKIHRTLNMKTYVRIKKQLKYKKTNKMSKFCAYYKFTIF